MIVYRVTKEEFSNQLISSGRPNRWNLYEQRVVYASGSISLCALELLAHTGGIRPAGSYKIMHIEIGLQKTMTEISTDILPNDWQSLSSYPLTQSMGSIWYQSNKEVVMKIPSAIIPQEHNYIINTLNPMFDTDVRIVEVSDFIWDHRFPDS